MPTAKHAKYLGGYLDSKLNWRVHIDKKREVNLRFYSLSWLLHPRNKLSLSNKRLLYVTVIRPIWTYAAPVWSCAAKANIQRLQILQNSSFRMIHYTTARQLHIHKSCDLPLVIKILINCDKILVCLKLCLVTFGEDWISSSLD